MKRLTKSNPSGSASFIMDGETIPTIMTTDIHMQVVLDRLAAYEDTGLKPEEVKEHEAAYIEIMTRTYGPLHQKIGKWLQAEKDGRLVVLPCKVGDPVWTNFAMSGWYFRAKDKPYSATVVFIGLNDSDAMGKGLINVSYGKHNRMMQFTLSDIGKTVFLTRAEAEAALKKEEKNNEAD